MPTNKLPTVNTHFLTGNAISCVVSQQAWGYWMWPHNSKGLPSGSPRQLSSGSPVIAPAFEPDSLGSWPSMAGETALLDSVNPNRVILRLAVVGVGLVIDPLQPAAFQLLIHGWIKILDPL